MSVSKFSLHLAVITMLAWPLAEIATAQRDGGGRGRDGGGRSAGRDGGGQRSGGSARSGDGGARSFSRPGGGQSTRGERSRGGREFSGRPGGRGESRTFDQSPSRQRNPQSQSMRGQFQQQQRESFYRGPDGARPMDGRRQDDRGAQFDRDEFERRQRERDRNDRDYNRDRDQFTRDFDRSRFDDDRNRDRDSDRGRNDWERGDRDRDWGRNRNDWNRFGRGDDWRWRDNVRRNWWRGFAGGVPFRYGWWDNYYGPGWPIYSPYRYSWWRNRPYYWWGWTPANSLMDWVVFGWDRPRYWSYGPGGNIYYRDNYVYYDDTQYKTAEAYYQQVYDLAHSVPNIDQNRAEQMEWKPLGVFALTPENATGDAESQRAVQLAISKEGIITGTYYNREKGHVHPVSGMIEDESQRAAWAFADGEHPEVVFETSLFNLTQPEGTLMVHFGPSESQAQIWYLLRLEREQGTSSPSGETTSSLP